MTLRLVLVSLVAALGLSLPSAPMIESWVASTQNWMHARFADWDTRNPPSADYVIVSDYYDPAQVAPAPALTTTPGPGPAQRRGLSIENVRVVSFVRETRTFPPLDASPVSQMSIVDELNRCGEGLVLSMPRVPSRPRFEPIEVCANPPRTLVDELNARHEGIGITPPAVARRQAAPRSFEPLEVADARETGVAYELNRQAEGIGIRPPIMAVRHRPATVEADAFMALEGDVNLYFAGELRLESGVTIESAPHSVGSNPTPVAIAALPSPEKSGAPEASSAGPEEEREELLVEVAGELAPADDGFGTWQKSSRLAAVPTAALAQRSSALLPVSDHFLGWIGFEVIRRSVQTRAEPAQPAPSPAAKLAGGSHPVPDLSRAVRLTREAVYAWVNVLTGPAIVTVSHTP